MASHPVQGRMRPVRVLHDPDLSPMWLYSREPDYGFRRLGGQSLFNQLMGDLQGHLDEMGRMRALLLDAYPLLALGEERQERKGAQRAARRSGSQSADKCEFALDVRGFSPEELTVKIDGRKLTVCGTHDSQTESEDGCLSHEHREVRREVLLPEDANLEAVACALSQDGRLCIEAPRLPPAEERRIPITVAKAQEAVAEGARRPAGEEANAGGEH